MNNHNHTHVTQSATQTISPFHTTTGFRPTLLCVAITLALISPALADTVSCEDGLSNCTNSGINPDIKPNAFGSYINVLTTDLDGAGNTDSLTGNIVTLDYTGTNPTINDVFGAVTDVAGAEVKDNQVIIKNGSVGFDVFGGRSIGNATGNSVSISGGSVTDDVFGGYTSGNATGNSVTISGGSVTDNVFGGYTNSGDATGNSVTISGGSVGDSVYGGRSNSSNATGNSVTISGGSVGDDTYGGRSLNGDATGNSVIISGGSADDDVVGGLSYGGDATGNTVSIAAGSAITFGASTVLYGGFDGDTATVNDVFTGNTLNLHRKDITVADIKNFENYNFYLQPDAKNGDTLLTLTSAGQTDISNANIAMGVGTTNGHLKKGHKVTLIKKTSTAAGTELVLPTALRTDGAPITAVAGISTLFDFQVAEASDSKTLVAELASNNNVPVPVTPVPVTPVPVTPVPVTPVPVTPVPVTPVPGSFGHLNPQTKSLLESRLANVSLVERGTDLISNEGIKTMADSATQNSGFNVFGATSYTSDQTETGSHIDVKGSEFVLGVGSSMDNSAGKLNAGGFVEFAFGSYDAYNDFNDARVSDVHSSGDTSYYGIGAMAQQTFTNNVDLSTGISVGRTKTSFDSDDILNATRANTSFDTNNRYVSTFAELGYTAEISPDMKAQPYLNVKNDHISSNSQVITGDTFTFDSVNSTRTTLGTRFDKDFNESVTGYADVAWEHEFNGDANAKVFNGAVTRDIESPTLEGDTAILAVGVTVNPAGNKNLTFNFGAKGSVGKRRGGSVSTTVNYKF